MIIDVQYLIPTNRQLLVAHEHSLMESLTEEQDPAMALHLVTVLLFQQRTGCMLHIAGRLVPHTTAFLQSHLTPAEHSKLTHYQELVMLQLKLTSRPQQDRKKTKRTPNEASTTNNKEEEEKEEEEEEEGDVPVKQEDEETRVRGELQSLLSDLKGLVIKPKP